MDSNNIENFRVTKATKAFKTWFIIEHILENIPERCIGEIPRGHWALKLKRRKNERRFDVKYYKKPKIVRKKLHSSFYSRPLRKRKNIGEKNKRGIIFPANTSEEFIIKPPKCGGGIKKEQECGRETEVSLSIAEVGLSYILIAWPAFTCLAQYIHQSDLVSLSLASKAIHRAMVHTHGRRWSSSTERFTCGPTQRHWCWWCGTAICLECADPLLSPLRPQEEPTTTKMTCSKGTTYAMRLLCRYCFDIGQRKSAIRQIGIFPALVLIQLDVNYDFRKDYERVKKYVDYDLESDSDTEQEDAGQEDAGQEDAGQEDADQGGQNKGHEENENEDEDKDDEVETNSNICDSLSGSDDEDDDEDESNSDIDDSLSESDESGEDECCEYSGDNRSAAIVDVPTFFQWRDTRSEVGLYYNQKWDVVEIVREFRKLQIGDKKKSGLRKSGRKIW